jgi:hypothetical protein
MRLKGYAFYVIDNARHHIAADHAKDNHLTGGAAAALATTLFTAKQCLIDLNVPLKSRIAVHIAEIFAYLLP